MGTIADVLKGIKLVDSGLGMAPALVSKFARELGASVVRLEPEGGDPGADLYPAYPVWRAGQQTSSAPLDSLLADADILIVGGEDFPDKGRHLDAAELSRRYPRLVVLEITGYPPIEAHKGRPAVEVLVQARSGLALEHFSDRPIRFGFEAATYGAVMQALTGLFAALYERERSGQGQVVSTSLYEGALHYGLTFWTEVEHATMQTDFVMPRDPYPLVFECADGDFIHIGMGSGGSKYLLYKVLGIDDPSVKEGDSGVPGPTKDMKNFFGDIDLLASKVKPWRRDDLQAALDAAQVPAEKILKPGQVWDDPQIAANGILAKSADGTRHVGTPILFESSPAPRLPRKPAGKKPLDGVRVVDFGAFVAGPFASAMLADLGADVIKVESLGGDPSRGMFHSYFASNRGKRNIALDIKAPDAAEVVRKLVAGADVITNNFRTGVSARLGLDAESLRRQRPELIVLESPAYGTTGPKAVKAGFDPTIQAITGHEHRAGGTGNPPLWNRGFMADFTGGQLGSIALVVALYHRERSGEGSSLSVALINGGIYVLSELIQKADGTFLGAPDLNRQRTGFHPSEAMYQLRDGWIAIAVRSDSAARQLAEELGIVLPLPRAKWGDAEAALIAGALRDRAVAETLSRFEAAGIWAEACRDGKAPLIGDAELRALGTVAETQMDGLGRILTVGPLHRFSRSHRWVERAPPPSGGDTREILTELGVDEATINLLYERKAVR